ncbi:MAG: Hpt domain-containing protein [Bdellovibrionales bacterium]|nr:Hpt domain-containing protein [Bdellovibrionales bacterium]
MEILKEQKRIYLNRRQSEIAQLKQSIAEQSFELAQTVGHRLKGHGETFGFPHISSIGVSMEKAAQEKNLEKLKETVQSLDESIQENLKLIDE